MTSRYKKFWNPGSRWLPVKPFVFNLLWDLVGGEFLQEDAGWNEGAEFVVYVEELLARLYFPTPQTPVSTVVFLQQFASREISERDLRNMLQPLLSVQLQGLLYLRVLIKVTQCIGSFTDSIYSWCLIYLTLNSFIQWRGHTGDETSNRDKVQWIKGSYRHWILYPSPFKHIFNLKTVLFL